MGGRPADRAARRRSLPDHRGAAVSAHPGRAWLLLAAYPARPATDGRTRGPRGGVMITSEQLTPLVTGWAPKQRWFGGKGRQATLSVNRLAELAPDSQVTIWTLRAEYDDGPADLYQIPLIARDEPVGTLDHVLVGTVDTDEGPRWIYDALHDKDVTPGWLVGMRDEAKDGPLRFERYTDSPDDIPVNEPSLVLTGEQSNTSMVFGDVAIMKVFRRLHPGVNPDIEIQGALTKLGAKHVPALLGALEAEIEGEPWSLAMLQEFMTTASDGWQLATASVRDLMAEADLHAEEAGGDFAGEAERLGEAVAAVHADLATAFGITTSEDVRDRAAQMHSRLDLAMTVVPELEEVAAGLREAYDEFAGMGTPLP